MQLPTLLSALAAVATAAGHAQAHLGPGDPRALAPRYGPADRDRVLHRRAPPVGALKWIKELKAKKAEQPPPPPPGGPSQQQQQQQQQEREREAQQQQEREREARRAHEAALAAEPRVESRTGFDRTDSRRARPLSRPENVSRPPPFLPYLSPRAMGTSARRCGDSNPRRLTRPRDRQLWCTQCYAKWRDYAHARTCTDRYSGTKGKYMCVDGHGSRFCTPKQPKPIKPNYVGGGGGGKIKLPWQRGG